MKTNFSCLIHGFRQECSRWKFGWGKACGNRVDYPETHLTVER